MLTLRFPPCQSRFRRRKSTNADAGLVLAEDNLEPEPKIGLSKLAQTPGWTGDLVPLQLRGWFPLVQIFPRSVFAACGIGIAAAIFSNNIRKLSVAAKPAARFAANGDGWKKPPPNRDAEDFVRSRNQRPANRQRTALSGGSTRIGLRRCVANFNSGGTRGKSGETVRRFFAAADAAVFANSSDSQTPLFAEGRH